MREPTQEEMIAGIEKAVSDKLSLMDYGYWDYRPDIAWPRAFQKAVEAFLEKHKDEIIAKIAGG
jgi:hypothetical protein